MGIRPVSIAALLLACNGKDSETGEVAMVEATPIALSATDHLVRASMALRGIRPSIAELYAVQADPTAIDGIVDQYLESSEFLETIKDLHAERLLLRTDTQFQLPVLGPLEESGYDQADVYTSTTESPLRFVAKVVEDDLPYTTVVTADWMLTNDVLAQMYGLEYDFESPDEWQVSQWSDGRPLAGLLSDSEMWRRHVSNGYNFHRGRANLVADAFLCDDFASRDVVVEGGIDLNDPEAVANAVVQGSCVGCHQSLDPLAAFFWGYKEQIMRNAVSSAYTADCAWNWSNGDPYRGSYRPEHFCYPLKFYEATQQDGWAEYGLRPPAYYGTPGTDTTDLGWLVADDPRFSMCAVRNFYAYFAEVQRDDVPLDLTTALRDQFVASNFSAKQLAKSIVLSEPFKIAATVAPAGVPEARVARPFAPGIQVIRPEQYDRTIRDLTGFTFATVPDLPGCDADVNDCWGVTNLMTTDRFGYRAMFGGVDGLQVTAPIISATPGKVWILEIVGAEAAGWVVDNDLALPAASRKLLTHVEASTVDEPTVRAQLAALHVRVFGEIVAAEGPEVDLSWQLFSSALAGGTPTDAWKTVLTAFFQDPRMIFY